MPVTNCIGDEAKRRIVAQYAIEPLSHLVLVPGPGNRKPGCARELTHEYYAFEYASRTDPRDAGVFFCGDHCAKQFLALINRPPLPLFNPLAGQPRTGSGGGGGTRAGLPAPAPDPLAREVYDAIHLVYTITDGTPRGGMLDTLNAIRSYPRSRPYDWRVLRLNRYVAACGFPGTLAAMVAAIPGARRFAFPLISAVIAASGDANHVE